MCRFQLTLLMTPMIEKALFFEFSFTLLLYWAICSPANSLLSPGAADHIHKEFQNWGFNGNKCNGAIGLVFVYTQYSSFCFSTESLALGALVEWVLQNPLKMANLQKTKVYLSVCYMLVGW